MKYDIEFKYAMEDMLETFMENQLKIVDGEIVGIPFIVQNIAKLFLD